MLLLAEQLQVGHQGNYKHNCTNNLPSQDEQRKNFPEPHQGYSVQFCLILRWILVQGLKNREILSFGKTNLGRLG